MIARLLPVGAFVCLLRETLEVDPLYSDLWLEGEVSDISRSAAGHVYFNLRDDDGSLKCVLFRGHALRQHQPLTVGDHVAIHGGLSIYTRSGSLQLVADLVRPAGLGATWLELEYLRQRLEAEGLFDPLRKRPLPEWPHTIGVVTSPHGAAWQDIQSVIRRRFPLTTLVLSSAQVQGDGAAESIVTAITAFGGDASVEVIILARGGGDNDDLAAFNDERVVRAVFASPIPVIAGIGHATDRTLVEDAADAFAPTPSAAAEICVPAAAQLVELLRSLESRLNSSIQVRKGDAESSVQSAARRLVAWSPAAAMLDRQRATAASDMRLRRAMQSRVEARRQATATTSALLASLNPSAVLRRGYAALQRADDDRPIFSIAQVEPGTDVLAILGDGTLSAVIDRVPVAPGGTAANAR
ncbi:MAG: exodeoxyribonuclease VII large subunit [Thermomicrobiales bacterium]